MTTVFQLSPQARARTIGDEGVVVLQQDAEVLITNESGARMLELCRDGATLAKLTAALREEFGADEARAAADAQTFVDSLQEAGAIVESEGSP